MIKTKITINGREYASPKTIPAELRDIYEEALKKIPALADRDGDGIPEIAERQGNPASPRVVVENQIIVNGRTYRNVEEMPEDVRHVYEEAMSRMRQGEGVSVSKTGLNFSFKLNRTEPKTPVDGAALPGPGAIEPAGIELGLRTALVLAACVVIAGLVILALMR